MNIKKAVILLDEEIENGSIQDHETGLITLLSEDSFMEWDNEEDEIYDKL